jgi:hypothetical protein
MVPEQRRAEIYQELHLLTEGGDFEEYVSETPNHSATWQSIFHRHHPVSNFCPALNSLFQFAVERHTNRPTESTIGLFSMPPRPQQPRPLSWLLRMPPNPRNPGGFALIQIHRERVNDARFMDNNLRLRNMCCLHEIGHAYLHFADFDTDYLATPDEEQEAWCFAFGLLSLYAEEIAEEFSEAHRSGSGGANLEHVWELIRDMLV